MIASPVSLRKSHDIVILSFCNIVKGQAKCSSTTRYIVHSKIAILILFMSNEQIMSKDLHRNRSK